MKNVVANPDIKKHDQNYLAYVFTIIWSVANGLMLFTGLYHYPLLWLRWLTFAIVWILIGTFSLALIHVGRTRLASYFLSILLWFYVTLPFVSADGIFGSGVLLQLNVVLTAGFLLGWRAGLALSLLTTGANFWMPYIDLIVQLPKLSIIYDPVNRWFSTVIPFGIVLALQHYATISLRKGRVVTKWEKQDKEKEEKVPYRNDERAKELETLYEISHILNSEGAPLDKILGKIANVLHFGWKYPNIAASRICVAEQEYTSHNYQASEYRQYGETTTTKGTKIVIEVVYLQPMPEIDEGPFLKEERSIINMLLSMLKVDLEYREHSAALQDYKYAIDIASIISISNADGSFQFVNENFCKISKYNADELIGQSYSILWSDFHPPEYFNEVKLSMQNGKLFRGDFCSKAKDGTFYWLDTSIVPFLDDKGRVYQYLAINYDITERKNLDLDLKQNEERNRALIENISEAVVIIDKNENIVFYSSSATKISGYAPEESLNKQISAIIHPDELCEFREFLQQVFNTPETPLQAQFRIIHKNGHIVWLEGTLVNMLVNKSIKGVILNYRDITEQKVAQDEIKQNEERYKSIIAVSNTGAWEYHIDIGKIWYSPEYFSMIGIERSDGSWETSLEDTWIQKIHPDDRERAIKLFDNFLKGNSNSLYESYFRMRHQNGHWVWIWSRGRKLENTEGKVPSIVLGVHIDISDRINKEEEIKQSAELLRKITSQVPGNTYMFEINKDGISKILFSNRGINEFNGLESFNTSNEKVAKLSDMLYDEDRLKFREALKHAYQTNEPISLQFRIASDNQTGWCWLQATSEKNNVGQTVWYGATSDITPMVNYLASVEQIIFDIGHVIRRPISSMLGLTQLIADEEVNAEEIKLYSEKLHLISEEMDKFIRELNTVYKEKRQDTKLNIDIASLIDRRNSLFG